jgi:hypothetical protein
MMGVFSADGSIIGTALSSLGNILMIEAKFTQEGGGTEEIRKYEIPLNQKKNIYNRLT